MNADDRQDALEQAVLAMKELVLRHEERLDTFDADFARSRQDFDFKLNALIDAQLKNEEGIAELRRSIGELRDESRSHLTRIEKLESV